MVYILAAGREAEAYNKIEEVREGRGARRTDSACRPASHHVLAGCLSANPFPLSLVSSRPHGPAHPLAPLQNTKALHRRLRNPRGFDMWERPPRMLPHAFEPQRMDVAVEHTPEKVGRRDTHSSVEQMKMCSFEGPRLAVVSCTAHYTVSSCYLFYCPIPTAFRSQNPRRRGAAADVAVVRHVAAGGEVPPAGGAGGAACGGGPAAGELQL